MGKKKALNNCCCGVIFLIFGVIFLILTFAVPIALVADPEGDPCTESNPRSLRPGEQMYCKPEDLGEEWTGEYNSAGKGYVDIYKIANPLLTNTEERVGREISNVNSASQRLYRQYYYFNFSVTGASELSVNVTCTVTQTTLRTYLLTSQEFEKAREDGSFDHSKAGSPEVSDTCGLNGATKTYGLTGPNYYYLIFSYIPPTGVTTPVYFKYEITPSYHAVDLSSYSSMKCTSNECTYKKMKSDEYIFIDYPDSITGPDVVHARIHNEDPDISGALAAGCILGIITIVLLIFGAFFTVKYLKKLGKIGKKAIKKAEKKEAEMQAASTPAAQPYPDQAYAAQPYPGQPM